MISQPNNDGAIHQLHTRIVSGWPVVSLCTLVHYLCKVPFQSEWQMTILSPAAQVRGTRICQGQKAWGTVD